jgi:hypothetical protein
MYNPIYNFWSIPGREIDGRIGIEPCPGGRTNMDTYEIHLRETLDDGWARRFEGWIISHDVDGTTVLVGPVPDQAALHGLLGRVRDLGLTILAVYCLGLEERVQSGRIGER